MRVDYGISFLMCYKVNQDFLESFFAMVRLNGGNDHPSPLEALNRIKLIILGKNLMFPSSANQNTELNKDVEEHFLMSSIFRKKKSPTSNIPGPHEEETDEDEPWTYEPQRRALEELDGQQYVHGYMAKSLMKNHDWTGNYTHQLDSGTEEHIGKENYVEDLSRGGLVQPSQQWEELADQMEDYFNHIHNLGADKKEPGFRNSKNVCQQSIHKMSKQFPEVPPEIIEKFVKTRINIRIRHLKKQILEKKIHRFKVLKNNKKPKIGERKMELSKNQKKLKHFIT